MAAPGRLSWNLATTREKWGLLEAAEGLAKAGVGAMAPWRDAVDAAGMAAAKRALAANGLRPSSLCRAGMFPAPDAAGRAAALDDNRRAVDMAAEIGAPVLTLIAGGLAQGSRDLAAAHGMVEDGVAALLPHARAAGVKLAIEPLHPMYAADRACVNSLSHALGHLRPSGGRRAGRRGRCLSRFGGIRRWRRRSRAPARRVCSVSTCATGSCPPAIFCSTAA